MRRHLFLIIIATLGLTVSVGLVNYWVDPLLLYRLRDGGGNLLSRIDQFPNMRLYKPYHVTRLKPDTLVIGTSRSGSLRLSSGGDDRYPAYNASMPGLTVHELDAMVRHTHAGSPLSRLVIGLDFLALVTTEPLSRPGFDDRRLVRSDDGFHSADFLLQRMSDVRATLFSWDMLRQSVRAVRRPENLPRRYYSDGAWSQVGMRLSGTAGYLYNARFGLNVKNLGSFRIPENIELLADLLDFCHRNGIETTLFFTPVHAFFVDFWYRLGQGDLWRDAHAEVLRVNRAVAEAHDSSPFDVLGFQAEEQVVAEPIYPRGQAEKAWFGDGLHYGDKLAGKIGRAIEHSPHGFGLVLSQHNLDVYLDQVESISQNFVSSNKGQVAKLHRKLADVVKLQPIR